MLFLLLRYIATIYWIKALYVAVLSSLASLGSSINLQPHLEWKNYCLELSRVLILTVRPLLDLTLFGYLLRQYLKYHHIFMYQKHNTAIS